MNIPRVTPLGDSALTITWPGGFNRETHGCVRWAMARLANWKSVVDVVPSYCTLSIFFDPARTDYQTLADDVLRNIGSGPGNYILEAGREFRIPVIYDGPDLEEVANRVGLTTDEVIARHSGRWYEAYLVGFTPGWAYLSELDASIALPRRASPRQRVPAGSVAIAGKQTGVYPFATPGGWHLIGRTDMAMFDTERGALLRVGDRVLFDPVR